MFKMAEHNFRQISLNIQRHLFGPFRPNAQAKRSGSVVHYPRPLKVPQGSLGPLRTHEGQLGPLGLLDLPMYASRSLLNPFWVPQDHMRPIMTPQVP